MSSSQPGPEIVAQSQGSPAFRPLVNRMFEIWYDMPFPPAHYYSHLPDIRSLKRTWAFGTKKTPRRALTETFRNNSWYLNNSRRTTLRSHRCRLLVKSLRMAMVQVTEIEALFLHDAATRQAVARCGDRFRRESQRTSKGQHFSFELAAQRTPWIRIRLEPNSRNFVFRRCITGQNQTMKQESPLIFPDIEEFHRWTLCHQV
jgi:hypothetical protein